MHSCYLFVLVVFSVSCTYLVQWIILLRRCEGSGSAPSAMALTASRDASGGPIYPSTCYRARGGARDPWILSPLRAWDSRSRSHSCFAV